MVFGQYYEQTHRAFGAGRFVFYFPKPSPLIQLDTLYGARVDSFSIALFICFIYLCDDHSVLLHFPVNQVRLSVNVTHFPVFWANGNT
jgi:hypothetical protein